MLIVTVVFWIIIASIIGGVILLRPVSKKLGTFLEEWIAIRRMEVENRAPGARESLSPCPFDGPLDTLGRTAHIIWRISDTDDGT
jgi:hypothetical protein